MITYKHSGTGGDLIYSLSVVKKMQPGEFKIAIGNIENCVAQYGYRPDEVNPAHRGRFTIKDYELLAPLLEQQPYIEKVSQWHRGDPEVNVDLDRFRAVLYRQFEGNIVEAYHRTFNIFFTEENYTETWLYADTLYESEVIVNSTARYRDPNAKQLWIDMCLQADLAKNGLFVGTESEHAAFVEQTNCKIKYRPVKDFAELAALINGCELFLGNQSLAYSIAVGLGKGCILEIDKIKPKEYSECYFPRPNIQYI